MAPRDTRATGLEFLRAVAARLDELRQMVEQESYLGDILQQTATTQRALERFEQAVVREHMRQCVPMGIRAGRDEDVLDDLEQLFALSRR